MKEEKSGFQDEEPEKDEMFLYDKYRFVCGTVVNDHLHDFVMQYGKLCGEQVFSKRIYLFANILGKNKNELEVRTDQMEHFKDW